MNKEKLKRIGALFLVFLLVALYVSTLVLSFFHSPVARKLFQGSIIATIGLPVVLYSYMLIYRYLSKRNDLADKSDTSDKSDK